jgi:hypothetical protein
MNPKKALKLSMKNASLILKNTAETDDAQEVHPL